MEHTVLMTKIEGLTKEAKEEQKLDPKAKVRNRGEVVFPAESSSVKDHKDHFKVNTEGEARNAWARAHQYSTAPPWYNGSLKSLQDAVKRKVHSKYPSIEFADEKAKKKSSLERKIDLLAKLAIYSDRAEFLASLAQGFEPEAVRQYEGLDEFGNPLPAAMKVPPKSRPAPQPDAGSFSPQEHAQYENLDEFGNPKHTGIPPVSPATPKSNIVTLPEVKITGTDPGVIKQVQQKLKNMGWGDLLGHTGVNKDGVDGILGTGTAAAIAKFKEASPWAQNLSGKALYDAIIGTTK